MKLFIKMLFIVLFLSSCSKSGVSPNSFSGNENQNGGDQNGGALEDERLPIVRNLTYPTTSSLSYLGTLIADLSSSAPVSSVYGTVTQGQTLNVINVEGYDFLVYGEDGVFAAECEVSSSDPKCEIYHAENFDTIILCMSSNPNIPILDAQEWKGTDHAFSTENGMTCFKNGTQGRSTKFFTY